jgi:hypothetical protein
MGSLSRKPQKTAGATLSPVSVRNNGLPGLLRTHSQVLARAKVKYEGICVRSSPSMQLKNLDPMITNDKVIRKALKLHLDSLHTGNPKLRIIEELGVEHGAARIDVAVINGVLHGYEIKSDRDTLLRLPEQMGMYNSVFDQITLVVGKTHLYEAINLVPDWWGLTIAKISANDSVVFNEIRAAKSNSGQNSLSVARLLWRNEALELLERVGEANGYRSKSRSLIYEKLSAVFDQETLEEKVRDTLYFREAWRSAAPPVLNGD